MEEILNEKQWAELLLKELSENPKPSDWIEAERESGRLERFFPELFACFGMEQNRFHRYDVYHHLIYACDAAPLKISIRLSALFHDIGKAVTRKGSGQEFTFYNHEIRGTEIAYRVLNRWGLPSGLVKKVTLLVRYHMFHYQDQWTDSAVRRILKKIGRENLEDLFMLRVADREGNGFRSGEPLKVKDFRGRIDELLKEEARFKITDLKIGGNELMNLGVEPGPRMGLILKNLFERVVRGELNNEAPGLMEEARKML